MAMMMALTSANYWSAEIFPLAALIVDHISFPTFGCILSVLVIKRPSKKERCLAYTLSLMLEAQQI